MPVALLFGATLSWPLPILASGRATDGATAAHGAATTVAPATLAATTVVPPTTTVPLVGTKLAWRAVAGAPQLLWTGFHAQEQNGEVLLQTSKAVEIQPGRGSDRDVAVFVLKHCRAPRRTDRLPLETRFFKSPVTRVSVRRHGADLLVTVRLRGASTAVTRQEAGPDGSWFWVLHFPGVAAESRTTTAAATP